VAVRRAAADLLRELFSAAVAGAMPDAATADAVREFSPGATAGGVRVLAAGKAARAMAVAAVRALAERGVEPAGGIVVAAEAGGAPHPALPLVVGDHPIPGARSLAAAADLQRAVARVRPRELVLVLLSGGATSLVAGPAFVAPPPDLRTLFEMLLASGADIATMNAVRKRFLRWGAGRLARALAERRASVHCLVVSDVLGDDLTTIASGPCVPDPLLADDLIALLEGLRLWRGVPESFRLHLLAVARGQLPETPKPGDRAFARVSTRIIVSNRHALRAAAARARELGVRAVPIEDRPMRGEASACGVEIARRLAGDAAGPGPFPTCRLWGGETTVTLGDAGAAPGALGGRCQELALAAARVLHDAGPEPARVTLLAAGTDGRDGPTDAAGAIVDAGTWDAIRAAGRDPARDLAAHDSYRALDAAGALLRTGPTGTNVMDVAIGLVSA